MSNVAQTVLHLTGIKTRPSTALVEVLKDFRDGQVLVRENSNGVMETHCGKISRAFIPDVSVNRLVVICSQWFKYIDETSIVPAGWQEIHIPKDGLTVIFDFDWLRMPNKLKEHLPFQKIKFATATRRCWLCHPTDRNRMQLFSAMLLLMFCREQIDRENVVKKLAKKIRIRLVNRAKKYE